MHLDIHFKVDDGIEGARCAVYIFKRKHVCTFMSVNFRKETAADDDVVQCTAMYIHGRAC